MSKKLLGTIFPALMILASTSGCEQNTATLQKNHLASGQETSSSKHPSTETPLHAVSQTDIDNIADNLLVKYKLITNTPSNACDAKKADGACFTAELSLTAPQAIKADQWAIYFSHILPIQSSEAGEFSIEHINGDLHRISLNDNFTGFKAGETKNIVFRANFWMLSETDALPNYIVSAENNNSAMQAKVIESTKSYIDESSRLEILPFVVPFTDEVNQFKRTSTDKTQWLTTQSLFERNQSLATNIDVSQIIIPTPKSVTYDANKAVVSIASGVNVKLSNVNVADVQSALDRIKTLGVTTNDNGLALNLSVSENSNKAIGSYQLDVASNGITIVGVDTNGVFNGLQSLASLITVGSDTLPLLQVIDEPHYAFRGMLVDVARNFHSKAFILKLLDQMAAYKLNKLHLHLGDDEGWRLEIPSLPELTDVGAQRCFDPQEEACLIPQLGAGVDSDASVNGFYSVADYQEILAAATARHIQVIPSLDMPGHSRSSIKAMTARYKKYKTLEDDEKATEFLLHDIDDTTEYSSVQYYNDNTINVCMESAYAFVSEVMKQVKKIHSDGGQPLTRYHIGADETAGAWVESPVCKAFVENNDYGVTDISQVGAYFIERVSNILSELDIETAGWSDGLSHTNKDNMPAIVQANVWDVLSWAGHTKVNELANRDWQIVISTPDALYFDFPYEADPKEHGYYWASRHTNTEKIFQFMPDNLPIHAEFWLDREDKTFTADDTLQKDKEGNVTSAPMAKGKKYLGIQGQLWSENTRTDDLVEHKIFPRLLALAERAWYLPQWAVPYNYQGFKYSRDSQVFTEEAQQKRDRQWQLFANTIGKKELTKLDLADVDYRLPTVGAKIADGKLFANIAFPGLLIEYQMPGQPWQIYQQPVPLKIEADNKEKAVIHLRSRNAGNARVSRVTSIKLNKIEK